MSDKTLRSIEDLFYEAMRSSDPRFDGKFFTGVKTTGIYCRPVCPAKPMRKNIEFFPDAVSAEQAGHRPCLRCRPECAPGSSAWLGRSAVVQRALRLLSDPEYGELSEDEFSDQLGVSARHLRRLFRDEIGQTPKQVFDHHRLGFARRLVVESQVPITEVAFVSGFTSIRRFNDAFKKRFHRAPAELRKSTPKEERSTAIVLPLAYRPPYDWESMLAYFETHLVSGCERVFRDSSGQGIYERVFTVGGMKPGEVGVMTVACEPAKSRLKLSVEIPHIQHLFKIVQRARRMFDVDSDPMLILEALSRSSTLKGHASRHAGLRIPGSWDGFERAVCVILGQVVSVRHAMLLTEQLVQKLGTNVIHPKTGKRAWLFPSPERLAKASLDSFSLTQQKKNAIQELSRKIASGELSLDSAQEPEILKTKLRAIPGIGPWTAEVIALRVLGDPDAYPSDDLILARHPVPDLEATRPWRGYAAQLVWKISKEGAEK